MSMLQSTFSGEGATFRICRSIAAIRARWSHRCLARTVTRLPDQEIDKALDRAGLTRADLFTPMKAVARHRKYMAHMIAAFDIDLPRAVARHWEDLKKADGTCAKCGQAKRCQNWLESGVSADGPFVFCPNAGLFDSIAADQAKWAVESRMAF